VTIDSTLLVRRQMRDLSEAIASVARDQAELRRAMETEEARAGRLRMAALERAASAQQRYEPFAHLFAAHLREKVLWLAAATAASDGDWELDERLLPSLLAVALQDPGWKTLVADARAALEKLDQ
jgi:hypothetical protein